VALLALGLLAALSAPAGAGARTGSPTVAKAAKKCKKKKGKKSAAVAKKKKKAKCKKKGTVPAVPPATGSGPNTPPPPPPPPPPDTRTTFEKIDAAVAIGTITAEQGLTYKVFASFGDPRLPSQYVGVPDPLVEAPLDQVEAQWNQLSDSAKATLGPFLIPPMHHGSYWEQLIEGATPSATVSPALASPRASAADPNSPWCDTSVAGGVDVAVENWHFVEATSGTAAGKVRVWYQDRYAATDAGVAANLLNAMQNKIWPALTTLMGREPLPDGGSTGPCSGGSDAVDIALVDASRGTTYSHTLSQESTSAKTVFPRAGSGSAAPYLAHEFMHMLQYSFAFSSGGMASSENAWLKEGTAEWAQDYVSSSNYGIGISPDQTEHEALQYFLPVPDKSLDSTSPNHHDYGSYLFWLWAARKGNSATVVRQVWNAVAANKSLDAAKSLFSSGWPQTWKDFTKANWNKDPVGDYQDWDDIHDSAKVAGEEELPNSPSSQSVLVGPVAAKYVTFTPASGVNVLTYRNVGPLAPETGVQAIITHTDDTKSTEDWSQIAQQDVPFCDIKELTLVFSNASVTPGDNKLIPISWTPPSPGLHSAVRAANVCIPDPQGTFSGTAHYDDGITTVVDWSWSGNVDFDPNGQVNPGFPDYFDEVWDNADVATGSITVSGSGTVEGDETCTIDIPGQSFSLSPGDGTMVIQPGPEPHYGIQLFGPPVIQGTITCPGDDPFTGGFPSAAAIYTVDPEQTMTRGSYQGSATFSNELFTENMSWNLADPQAG
jgi:hypothetical protein